MWWVLVQILGAIVFILALGRAVIPFCIRFWSPPPGFLSKKFFGEHVMVVDRKNVMLLTAHPDDESMFFVPTMLALNPPESVNIFVLCLSKGLEEGVTRIRELEAAAKILKVKTAVIYGHTVPPIIGVGEFKDGFHQKWAKEDIATIVDSFAQRWNIHAIISFDKNGVSSHPNHIALYEGLKYYLSEIRREPINIWALQTETLAFKYSSWLGPFSRLMLSCIDFLNPQVSMVWKSMREHQSQFVWFRRLFLLFSSYIYYNRLNLMEQPVIKAKAKKSL